MRDEGDGRHAKAKARSGLELAEAKIATTAEGIQASYYRAGFSDEDSKIIDDEAITLQYNSIVNLLYKVLESNSFSVVPVSAVIAGDEISFALSNAQLD